MHNYGSSIFPGEFFGTFFAVARDEMNLISLTLNKTVQEKSLSSRRRAEEWLNFVFISMICLGSITTIGFSLDLKLFLLWRGFLVSTNLLKISMYFLIFSSFILLSGLIFRTFLWFRYKPLTLDMGPDVEWPMVSVIMPALNEEDSIISSIDSIFASQYPEEKLEVITINDGSTDSTPQKMVQLKMKYKGKLHVIHFPENRGKREALYRGIKNAAGEIIITVDTDSQIDPLALRNIVLPLIKENDCGAVAGRVEVLNNKETFLTRMLSIRYSLSFNFGRAYQSVYGAVLCCPGALTAYRKKAVLKFLDEWKSQNFLNTQCTYGEDRALTTLILKSGYTTRLQSNAVVFTTVPSRFKKMVRMYLRWNRSCVRETILFARFMLSKYRKHNRVFPVIDFFFLNIMYPFHLLSFSIVSYSVMVHPLLLLRYVTIVITASFFLSLYYLRSRKSLVFLYGIPYGILTAFCLWWIFPFAALTLRSTSWMTR